MLITKRIHWGCHSTSFFRAVFLECLKFDHSRQYSEKVELNFLLFQVMKNVRKIAWNFRKMRFFISSCKKCQCSVSSYMSWYWKMSRSNFSCTLSLLHSLLTSAIDFFFGFCRKQNFILGKFAHSDRSWNRFQFHLATSTCSISPKIRSCIASSPFHITNNKDISCFKLLLLQLCQ